MNDLLKRYPDNKHVLYIIADWLYFQQDDGRSRQMLETVRRRDPDFPPALNLLGYSYIQTGTPDLEKAVASVKRYAEVQPKSPNPQDSLGQIFRMAGDDQSSLEHYSAALNIDPTYTPSHYGLGDTSALMGNYLRARAEYDDAIAVSSNPRDRSHCEFQKALVYFWEGQTAEGHAALDALNEKARRQKEPYSQFEIGFGRAMLAGDAALELEQLRSLELWLQSPSDGLSESDRDNFHAQVLRERARVSAFRGELPLAEASVRKLALLTDQSRDFLVANICELNLRPAPINRSVHRLINFHPVLAAFPAAIFHHWLRCCRLQLHVKIAEHIPSVRSNAHVGLQVRGKSNVDVPIQRTESHGLLRLDMRQRCMHVPIQRVRHHAARIIV